MQDTGNYYVINHLGMFIGLTDRTIANDGYHDIRFSFNGVAEMARVILKGDATEVLRMMNEYNSEYSVLK